VLSGFLISGLLFGKYQLGGNIDIKQFWIRRGFKIYPAFYAMMIFVFVMYVGSGQITWHILSDLFFLQDYIKPIAIHGWSLGVEEKFYFALPLLLLTMVRFSKNRSDPFRLIPYVFIALFVACLTLRVHALLHFTSWNAISQPAHLRIDSLFCGVTLGYYQHFRKDDFRQAGRFSLWIPGIALLFPLLLWDLESKWMATIGLALLSLGYGLILLWAVNRSFPEWRLLRGMAWIGRYSYSIYLWHLVVKAFFHGHYGSTQHLIFIPLYVIGCIGVGWLAAYLVETPFLNLREKLYPASASSAACRSESLRRRGYAGVNLGAIWAQNPTWKCTNGGKLVSKGSRINSNFAG